MYDFNARKPSFLYSPSVLDRLNSLLEPGGDLLISERGLDANGDLVRLKPHPDFRLILVVDENAVSGRNNISRAMRNRGVELVFTDDVIVLHVHFVRELVQYFVPGLIILINSILLLLGQVFHRWRKREKRRCTL